MVGNFMKLARKRKTEPLTNIIDDFYDTYHKSSGRKQLQEISSPIVTESVPVTTETSTYQTLNQSNSLSNQYQYTSQENLGNVSSSQQNSYSNDGQVSPTENSIPATPLRNINRASKRDGIFSNLPQDNEEYQNLENESHFSDANNTKLISSSTHLADTASQRKQSNLFEQISSALEETDTDINPKKVDSPEFFTEPSNIDEDELFASSQHDKSLDSFDLTSDIDTLSKRIEFLVKEVDQLKSDTKSTHTGEIQKSTSTLSPNSDENTFPVPKSTSHIKESYELLQKPTSNIPQESQLLNNENEIITEVTNIEKVEIDESPLINLKAKINSIMDNVNATSSSFTGKKVKSKNEIGNNDVSSGNEIKTTAPQKKSMQNTTSSIMSTQHVPTTPSIKAIKLDLQTDKNVFNKDKLNSVLGLLNEEEEAKSIFNDYKQLLPQINTQITPPSTNLPMHIKITRKYRLNLEKGALNVLLELTNESNSLIRENYTIENILPEGWKKVVSSVVFEGTLDPSTSQVKEISIPILGPINSWSLYSGKY